MGVEYVISAGYGLGSVHVVGAGFGVGAVIILAARNHTTIICISTSKLMSCIVSDTLDISAEFDW